MLPAGQELVRIALVADVEQEVVAREIEDVVQRDGQLDDAEIGREMAAALRHLIADGLAHLLGQDRKLIDLQLPEVCGTLNRGEQ